MWRDTLEAPRRLGQRFARRRRERAGTGVGGTEEVYFGNFHLGVEGGIEVDGFPPTRSLQRPQLVRGEGSRPISADTGPCADSRVGPEACL